MIILNAGWSKKDGNGCFLCHKNIWGICTIMWMMCFISWIFIWHDTNIVSSFYCSEEIISQSVCLWNKAKSPLSDQQLMVARATIAWWTLNVLGEGGLRSIRLQESSGKTAIEIGSTLIQHAAHKFRTRADACQTQTASCNVMYL